MTHAEVMEIMTTVIYTSENSKDQHFAHWFFHISESLHSCDFGRGSIHIVGHSPCMSRILLP